MLSSLLLLSLKPVRNNSRSLRSLCGILALNFNSHALVFLEVASQISLLGGLGSLGQGEGLNLAVRVRGLDNGSLIGLELLKVKLLDEVG